MEQPLPIGYFIDLMKREETWIQFKNEHLLDFYYRCGMLNYVTKKCHSEIYTTVKLTEGY